MKGELILVVAEADDTEERATNVDVSAAAAQALTEEPESVPLTQRDSLIRVVPGPVAVEPVKQSLNRHVYQGLFRIKSNRIGSQVNTARLRGKHTRENRQRVTLPV